MRKITSTICLLILASFGCTVFAQDPQNATEQAKAPEAAAHFYHLDFVVQEIGADGKPANSRTYTTTVSTGPRDRGASIRTLSRIPVVSGEAQGNAQFQYVDVGVNIDARNAKEIGRDLFIDLNADISSIAPTIDQHLHQPVIRQNKWQASVLIPVGKATVVFTSDSLDSKGSMQVVVTATALQ